MPKVTFQKDFVWAPKRGVRIAYRAGNTYGITSVCHAEAVKAGAILSDERKRTVLTVSPAGDISRLDVPTVGRGR